MGSTEVITDLHGHTRFSDGRTTPERYVAERVARGVTVMAVSDHDTFAAVPAAGAAAAAAGVTLLPAMEVTAFFHFGTVYAEQVHVLAYFPPAWLAEGKIGKTALGTRAVKANAAWRAFVLEWLASLPMEHRYYLDPGGELEQLVGTEFPALQSFLDLVMQRDARVYERFIRHHVRYWEADKELFGWTPEQAIELIRAEGGRDVVAHPVRYRDKARLDKLLGYAAGLEVYTSRHKPEVAAEFRGLAEARGKHWTASTDDHQHFAWQLPAAGTPKKTIDWLVQ